MEYSIDETTANLISEIIRSGVSPVYGQESGKIIIDISSIEGNVYLISAINNCVFWLKGIGIKIEIGSFISDDSFKSKIKVFDERMQNSSGIFDENGSAISSLRACFISPSSERFCSASGGSSPGGLRPR